MAGESPFVNRLSEGVGNMSLLFEVEIINLQSKILSELKEMNNGQFNRWWHGGIPDDLKWRFNLSLEVLFELFRE